MKVRDLVGKMWYIQPIVITRWGMSERVVLFDGESYKLQSVTLKQFLCEDVASFGVNDGKIEIIIK